MRKKFVIQVLLNGDQVYNTGLIGKSEFERMMTLLLSLQDVFEIGTSIVGYYVIVNGKNEIEAIHEIRYFDLVDDSDNPDNKRGVAWGV